MKNYLVSVMTAVCAAASPAAADTVFDSGKLLATGGVSQVEGAGGAGLSTWSVITGYGSRNGVGANAHYSYLDLPDFTFETVGFAAGLFDRVELSYARQYFDTGETGAVLGLGEGFEFGQDVFGAKVRLFGDAVYDQDRWYPQVSAGIQYKDAEQEAVLAAVGADDDSGVDYYLSATKLYLRHSLLLSGTVRATQANQFGLLGFDEDYSAQFEGSAVMLLSRRWAVGADYRTKPDNLAFADEEDAAAAYLVFFPNKGVSLTLAGVDLGEVANQGGQAGVYFSLQVGF
ncbi:MAG: DUF3034 family protein [Euryhalocaulis sp.]|uniref:DUF3034 family protein n=1 Tax=Euryhalocaulis sp. TaxID=2744307 RepID=UPI001797C00F|nr:DUF3034 family protein [Euryhalocaulis sp.]MBA4801273.1 DUF3034 family protein [Euryhalocaulis sp.]